MSVTNSSLDISFLKNTTVTYTPPLNDKAKINSILKKIDNVLSKAF